MGPSSSTIFAVYTAMSTPQVFFITRATFAGASSMDILLIEIPPYQGSFPCIGLIGIIIASIVNIWLAVL